MGGRRLPASGGAKNCLKERGGQWERNLRKKSRQKKEERAGASGGTVAHWLPRYGTVIPYPGYGFVSQELIYY
jgi:hypothetical protein